LLDVDQSSATSYTSVGVAAANAPRSRRPSLANIDSYARAAAPYASSHPSHMRVVGRVHVHDPRAASNVVTSASAPHCPHVALARFRNRRPRPSSLERASASASALDCAPFARSARATCSRLHRRHMRVRLW